MLRPYQIDGLSRLRASFAAGHKRVVFVAPGGSGKTTCAVEVIKGAIAKGQKTIFVVDRNHLVTQASATLTRMGVAHGFVKAGYTYQDNHNVYVASIQSLSRRKHAAPGVTLIIIDECDQNVASQCKAMLERYPNAKVVGLTATPVGTSGQGLGRIYDDLVEIASPAQLIATDWLIQPKVYAPESPDLTGVAVTGGDYDLEQLGKLMRAPKLLGNIGNLWQQHGKGKRSMAFCCTVAHSKDVVSKLASVGCRAFHLDADSPQEERDEAIAALTNLEIDLISNVGLFGRGFDLPALEVEFMLRPTQSLGLFLQMALRLTRLSPGKTSAILVDSAGNTHRHGFIQDEREWSLEDRPRKRGTKPESPVKTCKTCFCVSPISATVCPECGAKFEATGKKLPQNADGDLVELSGQIAIQMTRHHVRDLAAWIAIGKQRGYKPNWAFIQYQRKYHRYPTKVARIAAERVQLPEEERVKQAGIWDASVLERVFGK